jgi:hypothetical protein
MCGGDGEERFFVTHGCARALPSEQVWKPHKVASG